MQILPDQIRQPEVQVGADTDIMKLLTDRYGVSDPKLVLVFDSNKGAADEAKFPWKVKVFFKSASPLGLADLAVPVILQNTRMRSEGDEVIKTIYPDGYVGYCTVIGGVPVWIT